VRVDNTIFVFMADNVVGMGFFSGMTVLSKDLKFRL
jgi:hypothetical protein